MSIKHPAHPDYYEGRRTGRDRVVYDPATATLALVAVGTAATAVGAIQQGAAASRTASYNASIAQRNATIAQQQAQADAAAQQRSSMQAIGRARAAYGAAGVTADGSPTDVLASSASLAELDRQNLLYRGKIKAMGYQDTANLDTSSASNYLTQGMLGAGAAVAMGAASAYNMFPGSASSGELPNNGVSNTDYTAGSAMQGAF